MRVLSVDGGGIRGIIPARILVEIEHRTGRSCAELFDFMVGTSTGGILTLGLTAPGPSGAPRYSASDLLTIYAGRGSEIFPGGGKPTWQQRIFGPLGARGLFKKENYLGPAQRLGAIAGGNPRYAGNARYFPDGLERVLAEFFGDTQLGEALRPVVVVSYDVKSSSPVFFDSRDTSAGGAASLLMRDIARATSAGPTFFPPKRLVMNGRELILVDGGVAANNPAMVVYANALQASGSAGDVILVSLGTGTSPASRPADVTLESVSSRSWLKVASGVMGMVFDGTSDAQDQMLRGLLDSPGAAPHYWRLQTEVQGCNVAMDDASSENIACLGQAAERLIEQKHAEIEAVCASVDVPRR